MYISLTLLYLCFKIIHGEIIRCPLGGITDDEELCKKLSEESVFKRYYFFGLTKNISVDTDNKYDVHDIPYYSFKGSTMQTAVTTTFNPLTAMASFSNVSDQAKQIDDDYEKLRKKIFKQSIIMDEENEIGKVWNDTLSIGTDVYIIKFHNKLLTKYKGTESTILFRDFMVFIQSYYNAASTYYFLRMYKEALTVIQEGIEFSRIVYNKYFKNDHGIGKGQLNVWGLLILLLTDDISKYISEFQPRHILKLSDIGEKLKITNANTENEVFPSSVVLFYRRYFLYNKDIDVETMEILTDWANKIDINSVDKDIMYTKNISMYSFLVSFSFSEKNEDKLKNIFKAIQLPVLSVEDRLLNYKANKLAKEFMGICLDDSELVFNLQMCEELIKYVEKNNVLKTTILPKLKNMYYHNKNHENLIEILLENLLNFKSRINERILHVIVTAAIEMVDINSDIYKQNIQNIKEAIKILEHYLKGQAQKKNEKNTTKQINESIIEETSDDEDTTDTHFKINKFEKMDKIYNINYSSFKDKIHNMFIASKWLAELNGALCISIERYQKKLRRYLEIADMCYKSLFELQVIKDDDHLKYLKNKQDAKILLAKKSFEVFTWPGGWRFSYSNTIKPDESKVFYELNSLKNSDCPYINKIELNILLYRLYIAINTTNSEYNEMYSFIKSAVDNVVVTAEDRTRNLEAHELFSIFLMMRNSNAIVKGCSFKNSQEIYDCFLKPAK